MNKTTMMLGFAAMTLLLAGCGHEETAVSPAASAPAAVQASAGAASPSDKDAAAAAKPDEPPAKPAAAAASSAPLVGEQVKEQSFQVNLDSWGNCEFITTIEDKPDGRRRPHFYIQKDGTLTELPYEADVTSALDEVSAVSFRDLNGDGRKDIVVIVNFTSGAGQMGAIPASEIVIFKQNGSGFAQDPALAKKARDGVPYRILSVQDVLTGLQTKPEDRAANAWRKLKPGTYSDGASTLVIQPSDGRTLSYTLQSDNTVVKSGQLTASYDEMIAGEGDGDLSFSLLTNNTIFVLSFDLQINDIFELKK